MNKKGKERPKEHRGRPRKYDWRELFKANLIELVSGRDYSCSQGSMVTQARQAASHLGLSVHVEDQGDSVRIEVTGRH